MALTKGESYLLFMLLATPSELRKKLEGYSQGAPWNPPGQPPRPAANPDELLSGVKAFATSLGIDTTAAHWDSAVDTRMKNLFLSGPNNTGNVATDSVTLAYATGTEYDPTLGCPKGTVQTHIATAIIKNVV